MIISMPRGKMPCAACARKGGAGPALYTDNGNGSGDPTQWGPVLWTMLHILAEHVGKHGFDLDEARDFDIIINTLYQVLPCETCQNHSKTYISQNPFEAIKNIKTFGPYVRTWLLNFHNAVRTQNGQNIEITTIEQLATIYGSQIIQKDKLLILTSNANYGIRSGLLKLDAWKRWYITFSRLKTISES